jgi:hypothetical protein
MRWIVRDVRTDLTGTAADRLGAAIIMPTTGCPRSLISSREHSPGVGTLAAVAAG